MALLLGPPKKYVSEVIPLHTAAMSTVSYSEGLVHLFSFTTNFGDEVCGVVKNGSSVTLLVPREAVPYAPVEDWRVSYPISAIDCKFEPRHEQQEISDKSISLLKQGVCHIMECPTGWGKTVSGGYIACQMGQPTLIIVNKQDLVEQWRKSIIDILGVPASLVGHIQQDVCDWEGKKFVIGLVQSLIIPDRYNPKMYKYFGMVIYDEIHVMAADCFVRSCQIFPAKYRLGMSATPERKDGKTKLLNWHIGPTLVRGTVLSMPPKILQKQTGWKIPSRRKLVGNAWTHVPIPYAPGRMTLVTKAQAGSDPRNLEIANFVYQAYQAERRCLILSDLIDHLNRLFQMITGKGIAGDEIGYYIGGMSKLELGFTKKKKIVLGTYKMVSTGTDCPIWDSLVFATPRSDITQPIGRVTRTMGGKKQPVILDLVDADSIFQNFALSRMKQYYALKSDIVKM